MRSRPLPRRHGDGGRRLDGDLRGDRPAVQRDQLTGSRLAVRLEQ